MDNYIISGLIALIFVVCKFLDQHYIQKSEVNTKYLIRDSLIVYISSFLAFYLNDYIGNTKALKGPTPAYTGDATF